MDTTHIRLFIDVARRGSFATVARDHNLDPSSVSRTVAALEADLGVRPFQRSTRRVAIRAILAHFEKHGVLEQAHYRPRPRGPPAAAAESRHRPRSPSFENRYPD